MKHAIVIGALALAACAGGPVREVETVPVAVTHAERSVSAELVHRTVPPRPLGPRPPSLSSAADLLMAKVCEWVDYAKVADAAIQHAAGLPLALRVAEPACEAN